MDTLKLLSFIAVITVGFMTLVGFNVAGADSTDLQPGDATWVLNSYGEDGNLNGVLPYKEVTLIFYEKDNSVSGNGGVNAYGGAYTIDGDRLTIGNLISTEMAGPEPLMSQEAAFFKLLQAAESYQIQGHTLTIAGAEGILVFTEK